MNEGFFPELDDKDFVEKFEKALDINVKVLQHSPNIVEVSFMLPQGRVVYRLDEAKEFGNMLVLIPTEILKKD